MVEVLGFAAFILTVFFYAVRASGVRFESGAARKRKRWISGIGSTVLMLVAALLSGEPGIDHKKILGFFAGLLVVSTTMFVASFLDKSTEGLSQRDNRPQAGR